ncbi:glycosyltransferase family 2 protein [Solibacillus ferritrahens]|uniref:glycosyltransferase family 2 protein n=1 Tax=Solibacillus ferritrahens TaxID=3098620 RepID=UPI00300B6A39
MEYIAGIVLYNPNIPRLRENVNSIINQVNYLVLVDNGSENINEVKEIYQAEEKIIFVENNKNLGISKALNIIVEIALLKGYKWALLLDQDSVCPSKMVSKYNEYIMEDKVAIICPKIVDRNDKVMDKSDMLNTTEYVNEAITSGSLVNCKICEMLGFFNETMFIDYIDLDYSKRVIENKYKILKINEVELLHEIGMKKEYNILGLKVSTYNHSAFRKYYITRNTIYFSKKYDDESIVLAYLKILKRTVLVLLLENNKYAKIRAIIKGIKDSYKMS